MTDISPSFAVTVDRWLHFREQLVALNGIRQSTFDNQAAIARMLREAFGHYDLTGLRKSAIELWARDRLNYCKPVTVDAELSVLRQIMNWALDEGLMTALPKFPTVPNPAQELTLPADAAFVWYLRNLPQHHADAVNFMLLTGLAPHELARIQPRDFEPETSCIQIGRRFDFLVKTESRRRDVPMNEAAVHIWHRRAIGLKPTAQVFPSQCAMQKAMRRLYLSRHDAPLTADGLTPKMMRKWFASKIANQHAEAVLQALLGHSPGSPITRQHYVRSQDEQRREAVSGLKL